MQRSFLRAIAPRGLWLVLLLLWPSVVWSATETVHLPITLDYSFLRSFFVRQSYTQPNERAVPIEKDGGCTKIELWDPQVAPEGSLLKFNNHLKISIGAGFLGKCTKLVGWEGYIEVLQKVVLDKKTGHLGFQTVDSRVYNQMRQPATMATSLWNVVQTSVLPFLDQMTIDLNPPVGELKGFLPLFFPADDRSRIERWLSTLRPGDLRIDPDAIRLDVLMDVETTPQPKKPAEELSLQEIQNLSKNWESWDAYSVYQIQSLIGQPLTTDERGDLLETLLGTRYGFMQALTSKTMSPDLIGEQFMWSWQRLTPILRKYLVSQLSKSPLNYLAFFTSTDALAALQKLGPAIGLDISQDGLRRLAKFLSVSQTEPALEYSYAVNPDLRTLLGFGAPLDDSGPAFDAQEINIPGEGQAGAVPDPFRFAQAFWIPAAYASEVPPGALESILPWIPPAQNTSKPYLDQVKQVIEKAATDTLAKNQLEEKYQPFFRLLSLATAWQESCWRQFVKEKGKVRPVVSYNQSSVGLMQVNEGVWRGLYRPESLRWNIEYNAMAGSEILEQYLRKYALRKMDPQNPLDPDTLARAIYAMYNGGPGDFQKFLKRNQTKTYYKSDELFYQKYLLAKQGEFDKVFSSLGGH